jgi:peptide/nickel transport system permease protein
MATTLDITLAAEAVLPEKPTGIASWPGAVVRFCRRKPLGAVGGFIVVLMLFVAVFVDLRWLGIDGTFLAPYGYNDQVFGNENLSPSWSHWMGTDDRGRDILSRIMYGARISAIIGLSTVVLAGAVSLLVGTVSGYFRGWADTIMQRLVDIVLAIPPIILLIFMLSVFAERSGAYARMLWIIVVVSIIISASTARVVRGSALSLTQNQYVDAVKTIGATDWRIIFRHIIPNVFPLVIVLATVQVGAVILAEASISFLGLGIPSPFPSWGTMLQISGALNFRAYPLQAFWPGFAIFLTVFGWNMFGDALRDVLDPRLRGGR